LGEPLGELKASWKATESMGMSSRLQR